MKKAKSMRKEKMRLTNSLCQIGIGDRVQLSLSLFLDFSLLDFVVFVDHFYVVFDLGFDREVAVALAVVFAVCVFVVAYLLLLQWLGCLFQVLGSLLLHLLQFCSLLLADDMPVGEVEWIHLFLFELSSFDPVLGSFGYKR